MPRGPQPLFSSHGKWGRIPARKTAPLRVVQPVSTSGARPPDNYDTFLSRLDAATASLTTRAAALEKAVAAVGLLLAPYESAVRNWERRRREVGEHLTGHSGSPQSRTALTELHDVAANMESMLRSRVQLIEDRLTVMHGRRDAIQHSLQELESSRVKLNSSRLLSQDRDKLSSIFSSLAGSTVAVSALPDTGLLDDLQEAREAILLAEALIELKGN